MITTLCCVLRAQSVTLAWAPVTNASVAGYNVYYGPASRTYTNVVPVGNVTNATISGLTGGATYYFAATAVSTSGQESAYSSEVSYAVPNAAPGVQVFTETVKAGITNSITLQFTTNLASSTWQTMGTFTGSTTLSFTNLPVVFIRGVCSNLTGSVTLTWQPSTRPKLTGYDIYYGTASGIYPNVLNVGKTTTVTISNLVGGRVYYFMIYTYDVSGNITPYSSEISATAQTTRFSLSLTSP
ncbi:MAG TPA: fibronectin type III domain-containing protein [Candidatus Sulfopaludibacter sp.]|nr:fibronectin type III domain-containing protein [Candidatus Sulfopaludibacter sp.]